MPQQRMVLQLDADAVARLGFSTYLNGAHGSSGTGSVVGRWRDVKPAWEYVGEFILREVEPKVFGAEGKTQEETAWKPLSAKYAKWKEKHFPGNPILVLTGKLRLQMTGLSGDHFVNEQARSFEVGSNYPLEDAYGAKHAFGEGHLPLEGRFGPRPGAGSANEDLGGLHAEGNEKLPSRTPMRVTTTDCDRIADIIMDYVLKAPITKGARRSTPLAGVRTPVTGAGRRVVYRNPALQRGATP